MCHPQKNVPKNKGFTLIELLVVISVIALLASIAIVALNSARSESRDAKRIADIRQIASALELYFDQFDQYPFNGLLFEVEGYNEIDFDSIYSTSPPLSLKWDSSCGGDPNSPNDEFLTPLQEEGIMLILPDDPSFTTQTNCYRYTATKQGIEQPMQYLEGYYLAAKMENTDNIQNNCDIIFDPPDRFCLSQKH